MILAEICVRFYEGLTAAAYGCSVIRMHYVFGQGLITKSAKVQNKLHKPARTERPVTPQEIYLADKPGNLQRFIAPKFLGTTTF